MLSVADLDPCLIPRYNNSYYCTMHIIFVDDSSKP